ncbi:MAG: hypothetical protein EZS28_014319, partial [Streblomastix strix]
MNAYVLVSAI